MSKKNLTSILRTAAVFIPGTLDPYGRTVLLELQVHPYDSNLTPPHQGTQICIFNRILYKKLKSPSVMYILSAYNEDLLKMFLNCNRSCEIDVHYK